MIEVREHVPSTYQGKTLQMVCFTCHENMATHDVIFESRINRQAHGLCNECLNQLRQQLEGLGQ